jgi:hypothetical protein
MQIQQKKYSMIQGWTLLSGGELDPAEMDLVMVFSSVALLSDPGIYHSIRLEYPHADILLNSTAGEIIDMEVNDNSISLTAIKFASTKIKTVTASVDDEQDSYGIGRRLATGLDHENLTYVLVISEGLKINGSDLVSGLRDFLPETVIITGGLAGDAGNFQKTLVGLNEVPQEGRIVALGFYGKNLKVSYGSFGGWDSFGPERLITKAKANVLYELDDQPALDIYKKYLGEYAKELPGSGLLFPLSISIEGDNNSLVRTILSVNEEEKSLTFAGNMPLGAYARLMKANFERLIEGASNAANLTIDPHSNSPELAILISCVGRKLVLDQRVEEEIEAIRHIYGDYTALAGFYSYGEISPSGEFIKCELHNQTMTITTLTETVQSAQ